MATNEYLLSSLIDMDRYIRQMAAASEAGEIADAVSSYLGDWSNERIRNLQKVDGGWGPFDEQQRVEPLRGLADVSRIADSVQRQCKALKEVGIAPTPELLELDLFFFFARQVVEDYMQARSSARSATPSSGGYRHWNDRLGIAAGA